MCVCVAYAVGYKSRADEKSWNGASRRVLEEQIATHVAILKSVPSIYTAVEKKGVRTFQPSLPINDQQSRASMKKLHY